MYGTTSTAAAGAGTDTNLGFLVGAAPTSKASYFVCNVFARSNGYRRFSHAQGMQCNYGSAPLVYAAIGVEYDDTTNNITSLAIKTDVASGIGVDSEFLVIPWR